jgi:hypothetical protein
MEDESYGCRREELPAVHMEGPLREKPLHSVARRRETTNEPIGASSLHPQEKGLGRGIWVPPRFSALVGGGCWSDFFLPSVPMF